MEPQPPRSNLRASGRVVRIGVPLAVVLIAGIVLAIRFTRRGEDPSQVAPEPPALLEPQAAAATASPSVAAADGAPLEPRDARGALEGVSGNAQFRSWLAGDLVRRWVVVTENLAAGVSPRKELRFLAPRAPFTAVARGDQLAISADSYARYDAFADAVDSVDPAILASVYRRLHGALEAGWRALGMPAGSLDGATSRALRRILDAPVPDGEVLVRASGGLYELVDPRLERLGEAEKHLLRLGPRNERILQAKARAILDALALPAVASHRP